MSDAPDDLSPLAKRLFDAERRRAEDVDAVSARLLSRIGASVAAGAAVTAASTAAAAAGAKAGAGAASTAQAIGLSAKAIPWIVLAFAAGGGAGAAIHASLSAPPTPAPVVAPATTSAPPPPPPSSASVPVLTPSDLPTAPTTAPPPPRPTASAAPSTSSDVDLASERALVDRARTALQRRQAESALEALDAHAARFPRGRLAEEREALAVQALAQAGRAADAKRRADAFRKAYPNSIFGPAVDLAAP